MPKIDFVYGEDWVGMYLDGKLVREGHSFDPGQVLDELGIKYSFSYADCKWLYDVGRLPRRIEDVKFEE